MKKTVGLIFGGQSHEHEVSLNSAESFLKNVDYEKFRVIPFLITKEGKWIQCLEVDKPILNKLWLKVDENDVLDNMVSLSKKIDVFFPLIHGETGEDGKLQGFLEILGVPYVGCNVESSAVGMNKILAKEIASIMGGVSIVPYIVLRIEEWESNTDIELSFDFPVFVKPSRAGSSIGVSKVLNEKQLKTALQTAFLVDELVLIEKVIVGKEVEVAVIGSKESIEASTVGEISFESDFYDYENKYKSDTSVMHIPARMAVEKQEEAKNLAKNVYRSLGCSGYARVDFFLEKGTDYIYFNEINTSPGMTDKSMFPVLFGSQYKFKELLSKLIEQVSQSSSSEQKRKRA